ncbi:MAG: BtpA/SgcQ family protein [Candidatus Roizmanbacteria bacterium]
MFKITKPSIIGMIHLPTLVGYPSYKGFDYVMAYALEELEALEKGGIDAVLVENDNDQPHHITVDPETIACMTKIVEILVKKSKIPIGVEVMLNDPKASFAIAKFSGAQFIRTDYFVDRMSREEYGGEMTIFPEALQEYRKKIGAEDISLFADIQVKYAAMLEENKSITTSALQAVKAGADAIIVTGILTGIEPDLRDVIKAKEAVGDFPVLAGSGFSTENAQTILERADGAIVGSSLKTDERIDEGKVRKLMQIIDSTH